jgi:hypothetical protein
MSVLQGDCPTEPAHSVETLEETLIEVNRLFQAEQKIRERADARIRELEAALGWMIDGVQEWCDAVGRDSSWDGWDHHYKFFAYDDPHNGGLTAARKALKGSAPSDEGKP